MTLSLIDNNLIFMAMDTLFSLRVTGISSVYFFYEFSFNFDKK